MLKNPWVPCLADNLSDSMVIAATAWEELRHGSVSGTLGLSELARAAGREGDFLFAYWGVAVANRDHRNVYGRSRAVTTESARVFGSSASRDGKDRDERQRCREHEDSELLSRRLADGEGDEALEQVVERKCPGSEEPQGELQRVKELELTTFRPKRGSLFRLYPPSAPSVAPFNRRVRSSPLPAPGPAAPDARL